MLFCPKEEVQGLEEYVLIFAVTVIIMICVLAVLGSAIGSLIKLL